MKQIFPSRDSSPKPTERKRESLTPCKKEFKCKPELETKGKFIREEIMLHRQRHGLLSKPERETLSEEFGLNMFSFSGVGMQC